MVVIMCLITFPSSLCDIPSASSRTVRLNTHADPDTCTLTHLLWAFIPKYTSYTYTHTHTQATKVTQLFRRNHKAQAYTYSHGALYLQHVRTADDVCVTEEFVETEQRLLHEALPPPVPPQSLTQLWKGPVSCHLKTHTHLKHVSCWLDKRIRVN